MVRTVLPLSSARMELTEVGHGNPSYIYLLPCCLYGVRLDGYLRLLALLGRCVVGMGLG